MTQGFVALGQPALSAATLTAIELRVAPRAGLAGAAARAGRSLIRPRLSKFIPYIGIAITAAELYDAFVEGYNEAEVDYDKMAREIYDAEDIAVFRGAFTEARTRFLASPVGQTATRNQHKFILIPSQVMPTIAIVDLEGIALHGNVLTWDPAGAPARRRAAISGLGPAGQITLSNGTSVRASWEEYPFAVTIGPRNLNLVPVHVRPVPLRENWVQGGFITAANLTQGFIPGGQVHVYVV